MKLVSRTKKSVDETVEVSKVKRRGFLGHLGLKKKITSQKAVEEKSEDQPVHEDHVEETAAVPVEETKPLEPEDNMEKEQEDAREVEEPKDEEPKEETPAEEPKEEFSEPVVEIEEREQPVAEPSTPKEATSTGFLCGCI